MSANPTCKLEAVMQQAKLFDLEDVKRDKDKWPENVAMLYDFAFDSIQATQPTLDNETCCDMAARFVYQLCNRIGGAQFYLPKADAIKRNLRDRAIWRRFNGHNVVDLAQEYEVSHVTIRNVIEEQRKLWQDRHQMRLPEV